jgi:hypothetical protein
MAEPLLSGEPGDFEALLRRALTPVEPPEELSRRLESALVELTELAADELDAWELSAMRDPRNWVRPVAAVAVGTAAGAALVVLRVRQQAQRRRRLGYGVRLFARRTLRDAVAEARKLIRRE